MSAMRNLIGVQLAYFYLLTVGVAALASALALWHYGRRVLAGMRERSDQPLPLPPHRSPSVHAAAGAPPVPAAAYLAWDRTCERRLVAAWLGIAVLAALPVALAWLLAGGLLRHATQLVAVTGVMALLAVPVVVVSRGWPARRGAAFGLQVALGGALLTVAVSLAERLLRGGTPEGDQLLNFVRWFGLAASLLWPLWIALALSAPRRIRQVVPLVFGALVLFALGPFLGSRAFELLAASDAGVRALLATGHVGAARHALFALLALPAGWLAARRLRALAVAHAAKRFSDVQLQARAWWLMLLCGVVTQQLALAAAPWWAAPACALAGLGFVPVQRAVFARVDMARGAPPARTLLLLRAFGWRARTERLVDRLGARWRALGPLTMIAAPDVVARSIDAVDLLAWLQGREAEGFVRSQPELQARLAALDGARDPDGRYRVNEFCCADTTWQATVVALMDRADVVLMDLRGVQDDKAGCAFELEQLARRLEGRRVVLAIDARTRLEPLRAALGAAADRVVWHHMEDERAASHERLFAALVAAAC